MTIIGTYLLDRSYHEQNELRFNAMVRRAELSIRNRIDGYRAVLRGLRAMQSVHRTVELSDFKRFVEMIEVRTRLPGMQGLGFARRTGPRELDSLERALRAVHGFDVRLYPTTPAREEWYPITYLEPQDDRNRVAIGFDMFSEEVRREAMTQARDEGYSVASGKVRLVQEIGTHKQAGFLIYLPIYSTGSVPSSIEERRRTLVGFVYCPFRADDLFSTIMESEQATGIGFAVYDGLDTAKGSLMHVSEGLRSAREAGQVGDYSRTLSITIARRPWTLKFHSLPPFDRFSGREIVITIFLLGLLVSALVFLILRSQWRGRMRAEQAAEDLRRSEEELRRAKELAEYANATKDQFLAVLSHELRTPLTPILTAAELIDSDPKVSPELHYWIDLIKRNVELEARLIDDLLDITRIVRGKINLQTAEVDAHRTLDHIYEVCKQEATERGVVFTVHKRARQANLLGDPARLQQIYWNLVKNAIKFTQAGGYVTVETSNDEQYFVVRVDDNGMGIDPELQLRIFDAFEQGEKTVTRQFGGLGLGLAITKSLVELHGGYIRVESAGRGLGASFIVGIPLSPQPTSEVEPDVAKALASG